VGGRGRGSYLDNDKRRAGGGSALLFRIEGRRGGAPRARRPMAVLTAVKSLLRSKAVKGASLSEWKLYRLNAPTPSKLMTRCTSAKRGDFRFMSPVPKAGLIIRLAPDPRARRAAREQLFDYPLRFKPGC
jgi:hypothetical protein